MKMRTGIWMLGMMGMVVGDVNAQLIASHNFSSAQGYTNGPITGQPVGGTYVWMDGAGAPAGDHITVENGAMKVVQSGSTIDTWTYIEFPNQNTGTITVEFDWQYVGATDSNVDVGVCVSDKSNFDLGSNSFLAWDEQSVMCRMQQDTSEIDARNGNWVGGGTYQALANFPYTDGKKISMRYVIDVDVADQVYDVFAQKEGEAEVQLADDFGYRREQVDGLNVISIWMSGDTGGTAVLIDNIVIAGPDGVPTEVMNWTLF